MNTTLTARGKIILALIIIVVGGFLCYAAYRAFTVQPVTALSQQQAETPQGISLAAHNAHVGMLQDQLKQASDQIALLKNKPPEYIVQTVPYAVEKTIEVERVKSGADFAIVTDPQHPDKQVDLKQVAKLPDSTPVTLNQYNVFAYRKVIRGVNVYPKFTGLTPSGVSEITGDISRKISDDGKYIGFSGGYDFEGRKIKAGLRVMF